ncbi:helix-turn-helix transcriptional regulator [Desulforamulus aeronauticus]|uniref:Predicted DNA-binding transcriptional regulator YafY, contains an HTH and WYL domains n=1 Tax=Desulforamulus aeronauticus DSM 10349 TaxID=1121421 RepID=A0A1M6SYZ6_9FIRM|nr:YafY family protein [Desulforamulus aeronauticus]SHK49768.1 Predicted DNA-binding transcriptional regulator YafY, contains an HTH and WYL domains [Desulforamulus aeronauticus DSM 10349]
MKLDRLISILVMLLRRERVQAKDLANMFDVSVRTILRDVEALNLAGIPVVTYQGVNGGIGIAEGYRLDKSVLTESEMAAIITTLRSFAKTIPDNKHQVLLDKFTNILSSAQLELLNTKVNQLVIDLSPWGGNELLKEKVLAIRKATESLKEIEFTYIDSAGQRTSRRVEPYSLVFKGQKWYLYAWCLLRQDFRFFKLSRMRELIVCKTFYKPREVSLEQLPWESEWNNLKNLVSLELLFDKELASIVEEWFGQDTVEQPVGNIMVKTLLPENNWLYGFLLSFGPALEVVNPPHIRTILAEMAKEIYKKYT